LTKRNFGEWPTAQWVAWGIIQAKIPGFQLSDSPEEGVADATEGGQADNGNNSEDETDAEGDFDYLAYAQERAFFFWGDCVSMGFISLEELPEEMRSKIKYVNQEGSGY